MRVGLLIPFSLLSLSLFAQHIRVPAMDTIPGKQLILVLNSTVFFAN